MKSRRNVLCGLGVALALAGCGEESSDSDADFTGEVESGEFGDEGGNPEVELSEGDAIRIVLDGSMWWNIKGPDGELHVEGDTQEADISLEPASEATPSEDASESSSKRYSGHTLDKIENGEFRYTVPSNGTYTIAISAKASSQGRYAIYIEGED